MSFAENLMALRKQRGWSQEELGNQIGVTRQTVSKWEAGASYAEMDKLLQLCDLFCCSLDTLLRKEASESEVENNLVHREHMKNFRQWITCGVALLIFAHAFYELVTEFAAVNENVLNTLFMMIVIVATLILIVQGMKDSDYRRKHPVIQDFYTQEEKDAFDSHFPARIATGIGLLLIGILIGMNGDTLPLPGSMTDDFYYGIFLLIVTAGVSILIYTGMQKQEYDIEAYNKDNSQKNSGKCDPIAAWCGCIMLVATIIFLTAGLVFRLWEICWIVYPIGALLCGIVTLILNCRK